MHSSLIGKIEKARRYAQERDRVCFTSFNTTFRGEHDSYEVGFDGAKWHCTCNFFGAWGLCSHTMALERILGDMLTPAAHTADGPAVAVSQ
jgi:hypothetical protein